MIFQETDSAELTVGLTERLPSQAKVAWGAEVAMHQDFWGDPFQETQDYCYEKEEELKALLTWLNTVGFSKLRKAMKTQEITSQNAEEFVVESRNYCLMASPKASGSHLYLIAWRKI